ncbi:MAG: hypothetical protein IPN69_00780 [Acidobacteria bacterium]|nr:hypothetical protein [Acidobacteriota bacterium]MBK8809255.1 hypothetical protein [Acidobacteriota bacterium]
MSFAVETITKIRQILADEWPAVIYRDRVRTQRTRAYALDLPMREQRTSIQYTLLGIELKVGNKRFNCPDLGTARYLQVFARLGCYDCAVPYDITKISPVADALETGWQKSLLLLDEFSSDKTASVRGRIRSALVNELRRELTEIGAGPLMPEFRQSTKQRSSG